MINIDLLPSDVECSPLNKSGNFFRTRKASLSSSNKLIFKPTIRAVLFYAFLISFGYTAVNDAIGENTSHIAQFRHYVDVIASLLLLSGGIITMWYGIRPVIFDKEKSIFYRGWKSPKIVLSDKKYVSLGEIYSLQVLSHLYRRGGYGYQLNLILMDSKRIYIVGHRDIKQIRRDAKLLSAFLDVPVWESIDLKVTNN